MLSRLQCVTSRTAVPRIPEADTMSFVLQVAKLAVRIVTNWATEIWWNDQMVAEVRRGSDGNRDIDLYPAPSRTPRPFKLGEWLAAMKEAESRLDCCCSS